MEQPIIDIHPHVISGDRTKYPLPPPLGSKHSDWSQERPVTFEQLIRAMDEAGVDKAAIVQASTVYGYDNAYLADCVARDSRRFTGVFAVDMLAADAPERIRGWVGRGLSGLRLFTAGSTMQQQSTWLDDPRTFAGWECAQELGIPVCMQMLMEGLPQLLVLIERFPRVKIILDHFMKPSLEDGPPYAAASGMFDLARYDNVYLKLTTTSVRSAARGKGSPDTFFPKLVAVYGASRIAWGSNYPSAKGTLTEMVAEARAALACLTPGDREWIFRRTAQSLYPGLAD